MYIDQALFGQLIETFRRQPYQVTQGNLHQGWVRFSFINRGRQCTDIAAVSIALAQLLPLDRWRDTVIDAILRQGDKLYLSRVRLQLTLIR